MEVKHKAKKTEDFEPNFHDERLRKDDVLLCSRMVESLENENEPSWKEVKMLKEILGNDFHT